VISIDIDPFNLAVNFCAVRGNDYFTLWTAHGTRFGLGIRELHPEDRIADAQYRHHTWWRKSRLHHPPIQTTPDTFHTIPLNPL
jgi:hypothetical protein